MKWENRVKESEGEENKEGREEYSPGPDSRVWPPRLKRKKRYVNYPGSC